MIPTASYPRRREDARYVPLSTISSMVGALQSTPTASDITPPTASARPAWQATSSTATDSAIWLVPVETE